MSPSQDFAVPRFGSAGVVTDRSADRLKPAELAAAENMVLPDELITERGGYTTLGESDSLGVGWKLQSVMAVRDVFDGTTELVVTGATTADDDWAMGKATTGSDGIGVSLINVGEAWARGPYRGEALICPRDGINPILRWAFRLDSEVTGSPTGDYSLADGEDRLVGSASNFNPELPVGAFIGAGWGREAVHRVVGVTSDTEAALASKADWDIPSQDAVFTTWGRIGLKVLVTDLGLASHTGSSTTVTGKGSKWATAGPGYGRVEVGDWLVQVGGDIADALLVTAVNSDTSLTVFTNTVGAFTDAAYVILRAACGREAVEHDNALWVAGVDWAEGTVFTTPAGYEPGHVTNGRFGKTIQADEAMRMFEVVVGGPEAPGAILGLRSTPWGLAVGKSDSLWVIRGQYPALQVDRVAHLGVIDQRAMVSVDDALIFAGTDGIFAWQGGRPADLTDGRRGEWQEKARSMTRCVLGVVRGHLFVSFQSDDGPECWVYDLGRGVHLGNFTSEDPTLGIESAVFMDSARIPGEPDRLLFVVADASEAHAFDAATTIIEPGGENEVPGENLGALEVWSAANIGGPSTRLARVKGLKVSYVHTGATPGSLQVLTRVNGEAETVDRTLTAPVTTPTPARVWPGSGGVGRAGRRFQVGIRRNGGTSVTKVAVHELETVVHGRRPRA